VLPVAIEFMDRPCIEATEDFAKAGYPTCEALLIVEVEGSEAEIASSWARSRQIAMKHNPVELREAQSEDEAKRIWLGRKAPSARWARSTITCASTAPSRSAQLPRGAAPHGGAVEEYGLDVANVFHAGDGNMHPLILFDANKPGDLETCEAFGAEILKLCVEVGGCLTGEHGVGIEKRDLMTAQFEPQDLEIQMKVKDVFDPELAAEPGQGVSARGVGRDGRAPSRRLTAATRGGLPSRSPVSF
jgi:glycolate oxidase